MDIPIEILFEICMHLPYKDTIRFRRICRDFYLLLTGSSFWRAKLLREFSYEYQIFPPIISTEYHDQYLEILSRIDCYVGSEKFISWIRCLKNAIKKGDIRLVQYFYTYNQPCYRELRWITQEFPIPIGNPEGPNDYGKLIKWSARYGRCELIEWFYTQLRKTYSGYRDLHRYKSYIFMKSVMEKAVLSRDETTIEYVAKLGRHSEHIKLGAIRAVIKMNDPKLLDHYLSTFSLTTTRDIENLMWDCWYQERFQLIEHLRKYTSTPFQYPYAHQDRGNDALNLAVESGNLELVGQICHDSTSITAKDIYKGLLEAIKYRHRDIILLLIGIELTSYQKRCVLKQLIKNYFVDIAYQQIRKWDPNWTSNTDMVVSIFGSTVRRGYKSLGAYFLSRFGKKIANYGPDPVNIHTVYQRVQNGFRKIQVPYYIYRADFTDMWLFYTEEAEIEWNVNFNYSGTHVSFIKLLSRPESDFLGSSYETVLEEYSKSDLSGSGRPFKRRKYLSPDDTSDDI